LIKDYNIITGDPKFSHDTLSRHVSWWRRHR